MAQPLRVGDRVMAEGDLRGTIVVDIDAVEAVDGFVAASWAYLGTGLMVQIDEIGLVHYENRDDVVHLQDG
jgi:hypothetical protein